MKISRFTSKSPFYKSLLALVMPPFFFYVLLAPIVLQTLSGDSVLAAQEQVMPDRLRESYKERLPKAKQQEIIEKSSKIRKLQEGIIDHKIKILGSKKKERSLLGDLEMI
jgi:hypothetical protein